MKAWHLPLKQHRFELSVAVGVAAVLSLAALLVTARLNGVGVPPDCFLAAREQGVIPDQCTTLLNGFISIEQAEAAVVFAGMAVLPFIVGLLGGVPLVGRELELRTAPIAWSLWGSRVRWLSRQSWPVVTLLGAAVILAAISADALEATRQQASASSVGNMTLTGVPVVSRAFAAFSIGLLLGALLGRTLPAFLIGSLVAVALVFGAAGAYRLWLVNQTPSPVVIINGQSPVGIGASYGVVWFAPDGRQVDDSEAVGMVPSDAPDTNQWLLDRGYKMAELVVTEARVKEWVGNDALIFAVIGSLALASAVVVVGSRRPA